jgi:hypothetical protein
MSNHLKLFSQVQIGERFTFETLDNPKSYTKTSQNIAHENQKPGTLGLFGPLPTRVNDGVLVFTQGTQTDEVYATGNASELIGS